MIDQIIKRRKEIGISQVAMARHLYMHENTYAKIEKGTRDLTVSDFVRICRFFLWKPEEKILEVDSETTQELYGKERLK